MPRPSLAMRISLVLKVELSLENVYQALKAEISIEEMPGNIQGYFSEIAEIVEMEKYQTVQLIFSYTIIKNVDNEIRNHNLRIIKKEYVEDVKYIIALLDVKLLESIKSKLQNQIRIISLGEKFLEKQ